MAEKEYESVQLKRSILQLEESLQGKCESTAAAVVGCFVGRLGEIVTADIQRRTRITVKSAPAALFRGLCEIMQNREFIQLSRYPVFTNAFINWQVQGLVRELRAGCPKGLEDIDLWVGSH